MPRPRRTRVMASKPTAPEAKAEAAKTTDATAEAATEGGEETTAAATMPESKKTRRGRSSDISGSGDRKTDRRVSLRQAASKTAASSLASVSDPEADSGHVQAAAPARPMHGPDASGIDMADDTFGDMDVSFDSLDGLSGLDGLDDLDSASPAPPPPHIGTAAAGTRSVDTTASSFNVGLFRRGRPRQSSVHSRDDAPIRPSSRGTATPSLSSTLNLGAFKRRRREPSILGARRRRGPHSRDHSRDTSRGHSRGPSRDTSRDRGSELSGSEPDAVPPFASDSEVAPAESVVQPRRRSTRTIAPRASAHESSPSSALPARTTSTRTRKRKSEESEQVLPKRRATDTAAAAAVDANMDSGSGGDVEAAADAALPSVERARSSSPLSMLSLSPAPLPSSALMSDADRRRYTTPGGPDDEILAPPASSGSESESPLWPPLKGLATHGQGRRRGRTGPAVAAIPAAAARTGVRPQTPDADGHSDVASDISSPPSLTHSPNYRLPTRAGRGQPQQQAAKKAAANDPAALPTAALAALLPRRRHHARGSDDDNDDTALSGSGNETARGPVTLSEDEGEDSDPEDDGDELSRRRPPSRRTGRGASRPRTAAPVSAVTHRAVASTATASSHQVRKNKSRKSVRRTYGSRSFSSDKENQEADESRFSPLPDDAFDDTETTTAAAGSGAEAGADATAAGAGRANKQRYFGEELEKAAKKFKEVDKWTLHFERVSRSSSPVGAR